MTIPYSTKPVPTLGELRDVNINPITLATGQVVSYNATTQVWENIVADVGVEFEIQTGKTISENSVVMLNNAGQVYPIEYTGSKNFDLPIGAEHIWGSGVNPQNPTNTHFVAEKEFVINYEEPGGGVQMIGGEVDTLGNFTYGTKQQVFSANNPFTIASAIDVSTYGQSTLSGISIAYYSSGSTGTFAKAFTYDRATKVFTFGASLQIGTATGSVGVAITSIDNGRYIVSSTQDNSVYLLNVSGTTTTKTTTLNVSAMNRNTAITKISDTKVIVLYMNNSFFTDAQIVNISGNVLTLGNIATSTYNNYNTFLATPILSSTGKFYASALISGGGFTQFFGLYEYSYDVGTDTISINNTPKTETTGNFSGYDLAYYLTTNRIIVSGTTFNNNPAILIVDYDTSTFTPQVLDFTGTGFFTSSAIDADGDIVVVYNDTNDGKSIYGTLGDLVSNLDPTKVIGVVSKVKNDKCIVSLKYSVATLPSGGLTINAPVYVSLKGEITDTTSFNSMSIGRAHSNKDYQIIF